MTIFQFDYTVGSIVRDHPALSRVFEQAKIEYYGGGKKTLEDACCQRGIDPQQFLAQLGGYTRLGFHCSTVVNPIRRMTAAFYPTSRAQ